MTHGPGWFIVWLLSHASYVVSPDAWERCDRAGGVYAARHDLPVMHVVGFGEDYSACMASDGRRVLWLVCSAWECEEP